VVAAADVSLQPDPLSTTEPEDGNRHKKTRRGIYLDSDSEEEGDGLIVDERPKSPVKETLEKLLNSSNESETEGDDGNEEEKENVKITKGTKRRSAFLLNSGSEEDEGGMESKRTRVAEDDLNHNILKVSICLLLLIHVLI